MLRGSDSIFRFRLLVCLIGKALVFVKFHRPYLPPIL